MLLNLGLLRIRNKEGPFFSSVLSFFWLTATITQGQFPWRILAFDIANELQQERTHYQSKMVRNDFPDHFTAKCHVSNRPWLCFVNNTKLELGAVRTEMRR